MHTCFFLFIFPRVPLLTRQRVATCNNHVAKIKTACRIKNPTWCDFQTLHPELFDEELEVSSLTACSAHLTDCPAWLGISMDNLLALLLLFAAVKSLNISSVSSCFTKLGEISLPDLRPCSYSYSWPIKLRLGLIMERLVLTNRYASLMAIG